MKSSTGYLPYINLRAPDFWSEFIRHASLTSSNCDASKLKLKFPSILHSSSFRSTAYRLDMLINDQVIIELKAVESLLPVHTAQLLSYMKLTGKTLRYLINFNVPLK